MDKMVVWLGTVKQFWPVFCIPLVVLYLKLFMAVLRAFAGENVSEKRLLEVALSFHFFMIACILFYFIILKGKYFLF